jgi:hypothetical protein
VGAGTHLPGSDRHPILGRLESYVAGIAAREILQVLQGSLLVQQRGRPFCELRAYGSTMLLLVDHRLVTCYALYNVSTDVGVCP